MAEKRADFGFAYFVRMAFPVEQNVAPDPIDVRFFGADAVVFRSQVPTNAVEQFGRGRNYRVQGSHGLRSSQGGLN
jgi:hypothetical protein